jgi:transcriptional regulator with XRE-family HTH domain
MEREQPLNLIGKRVKQARLFQKPRLTQTNLASKLQIEGLDIDQSQVSKIENGTRPVTDIEVAIIARILGVSSSWLLGETDHPQPLK